MIINSRDEEAMKHVRQGDVIIVGFGDRNERKLEESNNRIPLTDEILTSLEFSRIFHNQDYEVAGDEQGNISQIDLYPKGVEPNRREEDAEM